MPAPEAGAQEYTAILEFWFGNFATCRETIDKQSSIWWGKDAEVDREIARRFEPDLQRLTAGELDHWQETPEGHLAMIILADQFPRNIYRDTAGAFAQDALALSLALRGMEDGTDEKLDLLQRVFFYMPLEHAESMHMQRRSVALQRQLAESAPEDTKEKFREFLDFAVRHCEVIEQFGRYPHRNAILGRPSTGAELEYLARPGSGF